MALKQKLKERLIDITYIPLILTAVITVSIIYVVYTGTQGILRERLRERLIAIASTAAIQFSPSDVKNIVSEEDLHSSELQKVVNTMSEIRMANRDIQFIYIFRKTDKPETLAFVADADMLATLEELDANGNSIVDDDEAVPVPGEEYDTKELPPENSYEINNAFEQPTATRILGSDKWGTYLSGFAPILNEEGEAIAILGIDVAINDYNKLINATLLPFSLLALLLLFLLSIQTFSLIRIWRSRVNIVNELDRQKDELLGMVSHQLATPITSVKWYMEMLLSGDLGPVNEEQKKLFNSIQGIVGDLNDLVGMILDVSRIQLGKIKVQKQKLNLKDFFSEVLEVVKPKAIEKKINFEISLPKKFPEASLDKRYTKMTIENLLSNAIKYTPEKGKVSFIVEIVEGRIRCTVADTGYGIPKADQDKIFSKLYRASNVRNQVEGNGFGLYVAKGAIENQGGSLTFSSVEGKGSKFVAELPLI